MSDTPPPLIGRIDVADAQTLRAAWDRGLKAGTCFVPSDAAVTPGAVVEIALGLGGLDVLRLQGTAVVASADGAGRPGVVVTLSAQTLAAVQALVAGGAQAVQTTMEPAQVPDAELVDDGDALFSTTQFPRSHPAAGPQETQPMASSAGSPSVVTAGSIIEGRFAIEQHLASGGMGEVYRATHVFLKRPVALKLLRRELSTDAEMWSRFQREAEIVSQLESPNIVRVFDFGRTADGQPFIAMELVEGVTLETLLERERTLKPDRAVALLRQVCDGLAEAHSQGIIHRDLKPANIIVGRKRDGSEVAKILDFGIARLADAQSSNVTQAGMVVGTPAYVSPEQALADALDTRTDIYSLGCVAFELLTGRPPFVANSLQKLLAMHLHEAPPLPQSLKPELWQAPDVCSAVLKALAKQRDQRFADVASFARALDQGLQTRAMAPGALTPGAFASPAGARAASDVWPPPESSGGVQWPPPPASAPSPPPVAADDFFAEVGLKGPAAPPRKPGGTEVVPSAQSAFGAALKAQGVALAPETLEVLAHHRTGLVSGEYEGVALFAEVLGPAAGTPQRAHALRAIIEAVALFAGVVDTVDEDGVGAFFPTGPGLGLPARAALAALRLKDEAASLSNEQDRVRARAALVLGSASAASTLGPLVGDSLTRARAHCGALVGDSLFADAALAHHLAEAFTWAPQTKGATLTARTGLMSRTAPALVGRESVLQAFDRRLQAAAAGSAPALMLTGHEGSGRTAVAAELAAKARKQGVVVGLARGAPSLRETPFGGLVEILVNVLGLDVLSLRAELPQALPKLGLSTAVAEVVLTLGGVRASPVPLSAGVALHAVRTVLAAGAAGRPVLLLFDGLERFDRLTIDAFAEAARRPQKQEVAVALAEPDFARTRFPDANPHELKPLLAEQLRALAGAALVGGEPDGALVEWLQARSQGRPGLALEWLSLVDELALLERTGRTISLSGEAPALEADEVVQARVTRRPPDERAVLRAASALGAPASTDLLLRAAPGSDRSTFERLVAARLLTPLGGKRWAPTSSRVAQASVGGDVSQVHRALAAALQAEGGALAPEVMAEHLVLGHAHEKAIPFWKQALEEALRRHSHPDLAAALKGMADALRPLPWAQTPDGQRTRIDALARAACNAVSASDLALAQSCVDEAKKLVEAARLQSAELSLASARLLRSEARRARAATALDEAQGLAAKTPVAALVLAERADVLETEGDTASAIATFQQALAVADAAREVSALHGEVNLRARLEARLAGVLLRAKEQPEASARLLTSAVILWRSARWPWAEARVLANLGAAHVAQKRHDDAVHAFLEAATAAATCGDLLFQCRQLLNAARVSAKLGRSEPAVQSAKKAVALAMAIGWTEGEGQARVLLRS